MKRCLICLTVLASVFASTGFAKYNPADFTPDYYIYIGYDFATGENVEIKETEGKKVREKRSKGRADLYKKYDLSHPEPLFIPTFGGGYKTTYFNIEGDKARWKFWRWRWYPFRDRLVLCGDAMPVGNQFFSILKDFELPKEEAQAIFARSIALIQAEKNCEVDPYLQGEYDRLDAQRIADKMTALFEDPANNKWDAEAVVYVFKNREAFPEEMPLSFYRHIVYGMAMYRDYDFLRGACRAEYQRCPTPLNAFIAAQTNIQSGTEQMLRMGVYPSSLDWFSHLSLFKEYDEANILDRFLQTVMPPEELKPVTLENLPTPSAETTNFVSAVLSDVPQGETFLLWIAHSTQLVSHFYDQLNSIFRKDTPK